MRDAFKADLEKALKASETYKPEADWLKSNWKGLTGDRKKRKDDKTGVDIAELRRLARRFQPNQTTSKSTPRLSVSLKQKQKWLLRARV